MSDKNKTLSMSEPSTSIFSELSENHQKQVFAKSSPLTIRAGETLINENDKADVLYFLEQGRLIVYSKNKAIAQISTGEPVGEIAFLTGGKRTATVVASRNCKLLQLDKKTFDGLSNDIPEITQSIIKSLANRLVLSNISAPELEQKESNVVALIPLEESANSEKLIESLLNIKNNISDKWKVIQAKDIENEEQLTQWIQANEDRSTQLILIGSSSSFNSEISLAMSEHADKTFLILNKELQQTTSINELEQKVYSSSLFNNVDLVILRENSLDQIRDTAEILKQRPIQMHHHVALNEQTDHERLQRFIAGKAVGLVLCGGGAFGSAHLGMIKALQEQNYNFDMIGGTSAGSAMAALNALGHNPDDALKHLEGMFIEKKAMSKYSIPLYSFLDHKSFDSEVKETCLDLDIEDLPINYFAIATNLSRNQLQVIRKGPLWQAVRSSCSIPGVLPPFITHDGDVLIDGAVMDNTPIKTLRSLKLGPNIVMNFTPLKTWKVNSEYEEIPRGWKLVKQIIFPKKKARNYYPSIFAILSRTMITNTEKRFSEIDLKDDIFLEPRRLSRMGMLNWKKAREQFDLSYQQMTEALNSSSANENKIEKLREASGLMKRIKPRL